jgi:hypothetical protein
VRIVGQSCNPVTNVSGGDGTVLTRRWTVRNGRLTVTVTDAAGGIASASTLHPGSAVCKAAPPWPTS